jgi:hypothetical protein
VTAAGAWIAGAPRPNGIDAGGTMRAGAGPRGMVGANGITPRRISVPPAR